MKQHGKNNRRIAAIARMEARLEKRIPSEEFMAKCAGMNQDECNKAVGIYWRNLENTLENTKKKVGRL